MRSKAKPKVAFFDFACCEGCQFTVLNLEEKLLDLLKLVDIVEFREAMSEKSDDYDVAIVEGSITTEEAVERIKKIRERAKILVALGACATIGGINSIRNPMGNEDVLKIVYGESADYFDTLSAMPVDAVVPVDAYVHGCPIDKEEFFRIVHDLLLGKKPVIPDYPVCVDCKMAENICVFDLGKFCLGPVTRAGCGAVCPGQRKGCVGCRGLVGEPNTSSMTEVLRDHGLTVEDVLRKFKLFGSYAGEER